MWQCPTLYLLKNKDEFADVWKGLSAASMDMDPSSSKLDLHAVATADLNSRKADLSTEGVYVWMLLNLLPQDQVLPVNACHALHILCPLGVVVALFPRSQIECLHYREDMHHPVPENIETIWRTLHGKKVRSKTVSIKRPFWTAGVSCSISCAEGRLVWYDVERLTSREVDQSMVLEEWGSLEVSVSLNQSVQFAYVTTNPLSKSAPWTHASSGEENALLTGFGPVLQIFQIRMRWSCSQHNLHLNNWLMKTEIILRRIWGNYPEVLTNEPAPKCSTSFWVVPSSSWRQKFFAAQSYWAA